MVAPVQAGVSVPGKVADRSIAVEPLGDLGSSYIVHIICILRVVQQVEAGVLRMA